jgi:hypothetical protein
MSSGKSSSCKSGGCAKVAGQKAIPWKAAPSASSNNTPSSSSASKSSKSSKPKPKPRVEEVQVEEPQVYEAPVSSSSSSCGPCGSSSACGPCEPQQCEEKRCNLLPESCCLIDRPQCKQFPTTLIQIQEKKECDPCDEQKKKTIAFEGSDFLKAFNESLKYAMKTCDKETLREFVYLINAVTSVPPSTDNILDTGIEIEVVDTIVIGPGEDKDIRLAIPTVKIIQCNDGLQDTGPITVSLQVYPVLNAVCEAETLLDCFFPQPGNQFNLSNLVINLNPNCSLASQGIFVSEDGYKVNVVRENLSICKCYCKEVGLQLTGNALGYTGLIMVTATFAIEGVPCSETLAQYRCVTQLLG